MSEKPATSSAATRLPGLDGLRGVACLMVFLYHLRWHSRAADGSPLVLPLGGWNLEPLLTRFDSGVAIFFVLSGLLLSLPFWSAILAGSPAPGTRRFYWRRLCRIVPAYYAVLAVVYLLRDGTYTRNGLLDFALHVAFLHNFTDASYYSVLGVLWTIGIELQFYLLLPLIMGATGWLCRKAGPFIACGALLVTAWLADAAAAAALRAVEPAVPDHHLAAGGPVLESGTVFAYLRLFSFGIVAGLATLRWKLHTSASDLLSACALALFAVTLAFGAESEWRSTGLFGWPLNAFALAILTAAAPHSAVFKRLLTLRPLTAAGTISYGIYLWHELALRAVFGGTIRGNLDGWALFLAGGVLALLVTAAIAGYSWAAIERRALKAPYPFRT